MSEKIHKAKGLESEFVILANKDVQRIDLSYDALGLLVYIMSLPPDWEIYVTKLQRKGFGRDKIRRLLNELESKGYLYVNKDIKNEKGRFTGNEYHAYAMPEYNPHWQPLPENPSTVTPSTVNPPLQSKQEEKQIKEKKKDSTPLKQRVPNLYYDAILDLFKVHGGHNQDLQKLLEGKASKDGYKPYNIEPAMPLEEFQKFAIAMKARWGDFIRVDPAKIQSEVIEWRLQQANPKPKATYDLFAGDQRND